jgi:hypothetical protein
MSVTMASLYMTAHMFGIMTSKNMETPYATRQQCVSTLEIKAAKARKDPNNQVSFIVENAYLGISNDITGKGERHMCVTEGAK